MSSERKKVEPLIGLNLATGRPEAVDWPARFNPIAEPVEPHFDGEDLYRIAEP